MAITNQERVAKAMDLLRQGLAPFVEREFTSAHQARALEVARNYLGDDRTIARKSFGSWDVAALLKLMWEAWNEVFGKTLGRAERSLVQELRDWRNKWAHQEPFSSRDAERAMDSMVRLLTAVSAAEASEVDRMMFELRRLTIDEQVRGERRKAGPSLVEAAALGALRPWREIVTPHPDVASGRYQQAEFAADLWQVHLGEGSDEYLKPAEFFRRTFLTESLKRLLVGAVQRISGAGGDPVVQLQTNFGGGKTHSMLALYHLFSGAKPANLPGVDAILADTGVKSLPKATTVVLVGNRISPGNPVTKRDGTIIRTLWGELAYQLGGKKAFQRIAKDDELATSPGDVLRELFKEHGPCLILIDEWVAYARQLHEQSDLPGGSFDTQFTFAQALTESAKLAGNCLLVISLPASDTHGSPHAQIEDVEVGGLRGREALDRLRNVIGRVEASWRPATAEEGFEIVRRRLFEPLASPKSHKQRDLTARAFVELYRGEQAEFPKDSRTADYERRIQAAFPIHPEIFDRLYTDWSTLIKFQRTRGVLRLMAATIHCLWEGGDKNPLILPSTIPIDNSRVQFELTRYLSDNWAPIISKDVDGASSLPARIDGEVSNLGKYHATRRVARTIYLGSAPTAAAAHHGLDDQRIKLGCVMPGEPVAVFGDALRRLAASATYLYQDGNRSWYSTQPTVTKIAEERAEQLKPRIGRDGTPTAAFSDKVASELDARLRAGLRATGDFARIHPMPATSADVPDDIETRLVVLAPEFAHGKDGDSPAVGAAKAILSSRGNTPRLYQNTVVFLAADRTRLQDLDLALRRYLAWDSIVTEKFALNLDPHQTGQAETQRKAADEAVTAQIPETYQWALVPEQRTPQAEITWEAMRLTGGDSLAPRVCKRLRNEELLVTSLGSTILRKHLDEVPLWRGDSVALRQLVDDFARYLYLPRLAGPEVLVHAVRDGVALLTWQSDTFAYAEGFDQATGRYVGLHTGRIVHLTPESVGLVVKPDGAQHQIATEQPDAGPTAFVDPDWPSHRAEEVSYLITSHRAGRRSPADFTERRNWTRRESVATPGRVADEVISHLAGLVGADVRVTLEISAEIPAGASEQVVRVVTENCRTLKFKSAGFEME